MTLTIVKNCEKTAIETQSGARLIDEISRASIILNAPCGGRCFCGKCRVRCEGELSPVSDAERAFLSGEEITNGWRLACACRILGDTTIYIEETHASVLVEGVSTDEAFDPPYHAKKITPEKPSLKTQASDAKRIADALGITENDISEDVFYHISDETRLSESVFAEMFGGKLLRASAEKPKMLGAAVDIGTTTMAAYLVDLISGEQLATASALNPQRTFGGDVISRAEYTMKNEGGLNELAKLAREGVTELIDSMLKKVNSERINIRHITIVGNTTMTHLFAGFTVKYIATLPFVPVYSSARNILAKNLNMPFDNAIVTIGPCVAGYVGADTVAAVMASGLDMDGDTSLMIDIGTNGEIALRHDGKLWCCSSAAGPAFEGAHIKCGSGAVNGAIDSVSIENGNVKYTTIGNAPAKSICGSGIISAIAAMIENEIIDETGRLEDGDFELAPDVYITQKDVREVQLAKAAIAAGIGVLADAAGIEYNDIKNVYLAGGFGNFINIHSSCIIGLLPAELEERVSGIGNAAGMGAKLMLTSKAVFARTNETATHMKYIELSASADFQERFADEMLFE